jgi:energy-coupling factor transporter ATP-binding protein EcfA2
MHTHVYETDWSALYATAGIVPPTDAEIEAEIAADELVWRAEDVRLRKVDAEIASFQFFYEPHDYTTRELLRFQSLTPEQQDAEEAARKAKQDREYSEWVREELDRILDLSDADAEREVAAMSNTLPANVPGPGGMPMLSGQTVIADLARPIIEGFNSGQHGHPDADAPTLPEVMRGHPLFGDINTAIGHVTALADRARGALAAASIVDVLSVLSAVHEETFKTVVARVRSFGCVLPEGRLSTAVKRFEMQVTRELRTGAGWRTNHKGEPDPQNADNVGVLLRFVGASLRFNVWRQRIEIRTADGDWVPFTDAELNRLRAIASQEEHRFRPTKDFMRDMIGDLARSNSYDPVCDWIDSQVWDGRPRLATWLSISTGVPADIYHQAIGKNVVGGLVKRARRPGCKHDEVMILIGPQGCGKSELTKALALKPEWHTDSVTFDGSPQNVIPQLFGKIVVELSELDGVHKKEAGFIKRFLSAQSDNYTAKYSAFAEDHARRCIFVGTCNLQSPLVDDTGNRRFYPVRIAEGHQINVDWLRAHIDQIVAEAAHLEAAGETFAIPSEVWAAAAEIQEEARAQQDHEVLLDDWFGRDQGSTFITAADLTRLVRATVGRVSAQAIGSVMRRLGFVSATPRIGGQPTRAWCRGEGTGARQYVVRQDTNGFATVVLAPSVNG